MVCSHAFERKKMHAKEVEDFTRSAANRPAFDAYLRDGMVRKADTDPMVRKVEYKFNPNHDPANGRFTFGAAGGASRSSSSAASGSVRLKRYYRGMTANGVGAITPTSGGHFDAAGRYVPEMFPPDSYRLTDPASALAHYVSGSGEARNYYLNSIDTSNVQVSDFPSIQSVIDTGKPGTYVFTDTAAKNFDSSIPWKSSRLTAAATVGRLALQANGSLVIGETSRYSFLGELGVQKEIYDFNPSHGRTSTGELSTTVGRQFPGKSFQIHIMRTKPFSATGYATARR